MKNFNFTKEDLTNLRQSYEWIDQNHFATADMVPLEFIKMWLDPYSIAPLKIKHNQHYFQRMIFLYGLYSTNSLLHEKSFSFKKSEIDHYYHQWQLKLCLGTLAHLDFMRETLPLDQVPLFLFESKNQAELDQWSEYVRVLFNLGIKNIAV